MNGEITHVEETDIAQAIRNLNDDTISTSTKMSAIDMRANLHSMEITSIVGVESLVQLEVFPQELLQMTLLVKRLSVSKKGLGREQIVRMTTRQQEDGIQQKVRSSSPMGILQRKKQEKQTP